MTIKVYKDVVPSSDAARDIGSSTTKFKDFYLNGNVFLSDTSIIYIGDSATNGSWRIQRSSTNLIFEHRESGSWVIRSTITGL